MLAECFSCWLDDIIAPSKSLVMVVQELIEDFSKIIVVFLQINNNYWSKPNGCWPGDYDYVSL